VSNILHLLNSKVEKYFIKTAESEKHTTLESRMIELSKKMDSAMETIGAIQDKQENHGEDLSKEVARLEAEIETARRKVKRLESHFINFAKSVEE